MHCIPIQGQYRLRTGFSLRSISTQGKTCFHYRVSGPVDENRIFPVRNTTQGKPCFHYRDGFAVWLKSAGLKLGVGMSFNHVKCTPTALQMLISCMRSIIFLPVFCTPICRTFNSLTLATVERSYFLRIVLNSRVPAYTRILELGKTAFSQTALIIVN